VQTTTYSRVGANHRLDAWVRLLAVTAVRPETPWRAVTIGRGSEDRVAVVEIPPLGEDAAERRAAALEHLATVVDLHDRGVREPIPLACKTSEAYASVRVRGGDARKAACNRWESTPWRDFEDADPEHVLAFRGRIAFDALYEPGPRDDERGAGWDAEEPTRFGRYAMRLWRPLLDVEETREL
jgi:exodeoxyribonuclease V gamma subunit